MVGLQNSLTYHRAQKHHRSIDCHPLYEREKGFKGETTEGKIDILRIDEIEVTRKESVVVNGFAEAAPQDQSKAKIFT